MEFLRFRHIPFYFSTKTFYRTYSSHPKWKSRSKCSVCGSLPHDLKLSDVFTRTRHDVSRYYVIIREYPKYQTTNKLRTTTNLTWNRTPLRYEEEKITREILLMTSLSLEFFSLRFAVCNLQSAVCSLQSAVCNLQSAICSLQSAVCNLQSAVCNLQSAICSLQSANVRHRVSYNPLTLLKRAPRY